MGIKIKKKKKKSRTLADMAQQEIRKISNIFFFI